MESSKMTEKPEPDTLIRMESSLVLRMDVEIDFFDERFVEAIEGITKNLNSAGRTKEQIFWVTGNYNFYEPFPLDMIHGMDYTEYYKVIGYCYIRHSKIKNPNNQIKHKGELND